MASYALHITQTPHTFQVHTFHIISISTVKSDEMGAAYWENATYMKVIHAARYMK